MEGGGRAVPVLEVSRGCWGGWLGCGCSCRLVNIRRIKIRYPPTCRLVRGVYQLGPGLLLPSPISEGAVDGLPGSAVSYSSM